jgi:hypothetical protein
MTHLPKRYFLISHDELEGGSLKSLLLGAAITGAAAYAGHRIMKNKVAEAEAMKQQQKANVINLAESQGGDPQTYLKAFNLA